MPVSLIKVFAVILFFCSLTFARENKKNIPEGPGYYKLLNGASLPLSIPFRMVRNKPVMDLEINGKMAALMIDNGVLWDEVWLFGSPLVEELKLKPITDGSIEGAGEGDPTQAYTSSNLTLIFGDIEFYEQPSLVSPPAAGFARMFPGTDGQLCNTFFKHFAVEFDFINNRVILHDPDTYKYSGEGSVLPMTTEEIGSHTVPFSFILSNGKEYEGDVMIDFGGIRALKIALNNKHNIQLPEDAAPGRSFGAQGLSREYSGKIKSMTFGKYTFDNPVVYFGDRNTSRIHPDNLGMIGFPLFRQFNITFDYITNHLYFHPNENFGKTFE